MAFAYQAFESPSIRSQASRLKRRELLVWVIGILFVADLTRIEVSSSSEIMRALIESVTSRSVFYYLGIYAVVRLLLGGDTDREVSRVDIVLGLAVCFIGLVPFKSAVWAAATAWASYLYFSSAGDRKTEAAAIVLLALATNMLWGPIIFDLCESTLLRVDAALTGATLTAANTGVTWHGNVVGTPQGHSIIILSGCSSFHNISLGLLCWVALTKLARPIWTWGDLPFAIGVVAIVVGLNVGRLSLMALSFDHYTYWHDGFGSQIFEIVTTLAVLGFSLLGACRNPGAVS